MLATQRKQGFQGRFGSNYGPSDHLSCAAAVRDRQLVGRWAILSEATTGISVRKRLVGSASGRVIVVSSIAGFHVRGTPDTGT